MTIVARGPGVIACSFTDMEDKSANGRYRWEFSWMFGPTWVDKRGEPLKRQPIPGESARANAMWAAFEEWFAPLKAKKYGLPQGENL